MTLRQPLVRRRNPGKTSIPTWFRRPSDGIHLQGRQIRRALAMRGEHVWWRPPVVPRPCGGRRLAAPSLACSSRRAPTRPPPRQAGDPRVKATPSSARRDRPATPRLPRLVRRPRRRIPPLGSLRLALRYPTSRGHRHPITAGDHGPGPPGATAPTTRSHPPCARSARHRRISSASPSAWAAGGNISRAHACNPTFAGLVIAGCRSAPTFASAARAGRATLRSATWQ